MTFFCSVRRFQCKCLCTFKICFILRSIYLTTSLKSVVQFLSDQSFSSCQITVRLRHFFLIMINLYVTPFPLDNIFSNLSQSWNRISIVQSRTISYSIGLGSRSTYFKLCITTKPDCYVNYWSHDSYASSYAFISFSCRYEYRIQKLGVSEVLNSCIIATIVKLGHNVLLHSLMHTTPNFVPTMTVFFCANRSKLT